MARQKPEVSALPAFLEKPRVRDLVLFAVPFLLYFASVFNGYNIDDELVTNGNPRVAKGLAGIPEILTSRYIDGGGLKADYRPVAHLTFALEHQLFGFNPAVSHLVNVLLYGLTALLLFRVLARLFSGYLSPALILAAVLLFAAHPLHAEVVCSLKNRDELICFLFILLALLRLDRFLDKPGAAAFAGLLLCTGLALVSKLSAVPLFCILPAYTWLKTRGKADRRTWGPVLIVSALIVAYMFVNLSTSVRPIIYIENPLVRVSEIGVKWPTVLVIALTYLKMLVFPLHLGFYYGYDTVPVVTFTSPWPFLSLVVHAGLVLLGYRYRRSYPFLAWCVAGYFFSIALYVSFFMPYTGIIADRAMYLASLFFVLLLILLLRQVLQLSDKTVVTIAFLLASAYGVRSFVRVFDWKDAETLMRRDIGYLRNSAQANYMFAYHLDRHASDSGDTLYRRGVIGTSLFHYREVIRILPDYADSYYRIAQIERFTNNDPAAAAGYYRQTFVHDTTRNDALFGYAGSQLALGNYAEAVQVFGMQYARMPSDTMLLFYYAQALDLAGDVAGAERINRELLDLAPQSQYPYLNLGALAYKQGNLEQSVAYYETAVRFGCRDANLLNLLAAHFRAKGQAEKANYFASLNVSDPLP